MTSWRSALIAIAITLVSHVACQQYEYCLTDVEVTDVTNSSFRIQWRYNCPMVGKIKYKIYYNHVKYMSCPGSVNDRSRGAGRGNTETFDQYVIIDNLHPYSRYHLTVKALHLEASSFEDGIPEEFELFGETDSGEPEVKPSESSMNHISTSHELTFTWVIPSVTECSKFNAELDSTHYMLKGASMWNMHQKFVGFTAQSSISFTDLYPFSVYSLYLRSANSERGLINDDMYLKLTGDTSSEIPLPPENISVLLGNEITRDRVRDVDKWLIWMPAYPPTGRVEEYIIRFTANVPVSQDDEHVTYDWDTNVLSLSSSTCQSEQRYALLASNPEVNSVVEPACYKIDFPSHSNYTVQIQTKNRNVSKPSEWSVPFYVDTFPRKIPPRQNEGEPWWVILILATLGLTCSLMLCCLAMFVYHKFFNKSRGRQNNRHGASKNEDVGALGSGSAEPLVRIVNPTSPVTNHRTTVNDRVEYLKHTYENHFLPQSSPHSSIVRVKKPGRADSMMRRVERGSMTNLSIQDLPLPPAPPAADSQHLYEELKNARGVQQIMSMSAHESLAVDENSAAYLTPKTSPSKKSCPDVSTTYHNTSSATLDIDDYLKPTFNQSIAVDKSMGQSQNGDGQKCNDVMNEGVPLVSYESTTPSQSTGKGLNSSQDPLSSKTMVTEI